MFKNVNKLILTAAGIFSLSTLTAQAGPNCAAKLYVQKGSIASATEHFTARGSSNQQAYLQARRCVEMHWAARWDRKKPEDCKPGKKVDNYGLNDLKKWIENRACEKGWKSGTVKLVFKSKGGSGCSKKVNIASYQMQNRYCK